MLTFQNWLSSIEIFAVFISAIVHDYEHTGTTNNFHIQTRSDIALIYNDRAVLENYHISTTFKLMKNDNYNILQELSREEFKYILNFELVNSPVYFHLSFEIFFLGNFVVYALK